MNTKLWSEPITLEEIERTVNEYVTQRKIDIQKNGLLEKWNFFPILKTEKKEVLEKFLELIQNINTLTIPIDKKIGCVLTLVYLVAKEKMPILELDINSSLLLVLYLDELPLQNIKTSLQYCNNETLLTKIRLKSLDLDVRVKLMRYLDKLKKPIDQVTQAIDATDYYELLKILES